MKNQVIMGKAKELSKLFSILSDKEVREIIEAAGVNFIEPGTAGRIDYLNVADEADQEIITKLYMQKIQSKLESALVALE